MRNRGVLVGWRSSVASQSLDQSPSHSTSCPSQLTPGTPIKETVDSPTVDIAMEVTAGDNLLKLEFAESEEKMRMTPSPAPESVPSVKSGFLFHPTALAFDPVQKVVAIGNRSGAIRIVGWKRDAEIDSHVRHPAGAAVIQLSFVVNEGLLMSLNADDAIHLWNYKLKLPELINSLKFTRERLITFHLPLQSKWMYIGTEKGNTHVANTDSFLLSGYVINWNKAIDLVQKTHPGPVVHLSDCPIDPNKLLIGFESGLIVFWDLKNRSADCRFSYHVVSLPSYIIFHQILNSLFLLLLRKSIHQILAQETLSRPSSTCHTTFSLFHYFTVTPFIPVPLLFVAILFV